MTLWCGFFQPSVRVFVQILLWFVNDSLCFAAEYIVTTVSYMRSWLSCTMSIEDIGRLLLEFKILRK